MRKSAENFIAPLRALFTRWSTKKIIPLELIKSDWDFRAAVIELPPQEVPEPMEFRKTRQSAAKSMPITAKL
jgi:hypothetical protein